LAGVAIIAEKHLATGFRLAGIEAFPIENIEDAKTALSRIITEEKHDIIILTERLSKELHNEKSKILSRRKGKPIFAIIPDFHGPTGQRTRELHDLISESVGAELKFE
jgi:vacuolar-type H+-ATPase subunit F/Vma7